MIPWTRLAVKLHHKDIWRPNGKTQPQPNHSSFLCGWVNLAWLVLSSFSRWPGKIMAPPNKKWLWDDMEVPEESFHWSSWDSWTCYPRRAFIQGLTDDCSPEHVGSWIVGSQTLFVFLMIWDLGTNWQPPCVSSSFLGGCRLSSSFHWLAEPSFLLMANQD